MQKVKEKYYAICTHEYTLSSFLIVVFLFIFRADRLQDGNYLFFKQIVRLAIFVDCGLVLSVRNNRWDSSAPYRFFCFKLMHALPNSSSGSFFNVGDGHYIYSH
jgi:hypothetical protein